MTSPEQVFISQVSNYCSFNYEKTCKQKKTPENHRTALKSNKVLIGENVLKHFKALVTVPEAEINVLTITGSCLTSPQVEYY